MERNEFLRKLSISMVTVCSGCAVISCSNNSAKEKDPTPTPPNPPKPGPGNIVTADLVTELLSVGSSKKAEDVIVVRIGAGNVISSFTAVASACTHAGGPLAYNNADSVFVCPVHGSRFGQNGQVVTGPAAMALKKYTITITGNALVVVA